VLSSALGHAAKIGKLPANPALGVRKIPVPVTRPRAITPLQVERIRAAMPTQRDRVLVGLFYYAGLRPEEAFALTWDSVLDDYLLIDKSFTAGELKGTKTGRLRHVDLIAPLRDDLDELRPEDVDGGAFVAPNAKGTPIDLHVWRRRVWYPARDKAGVQARPYDGRHTFVSLRYAEGKLPYEVGNQVGHTTSKMTDRYSHLYRTSEHASRTPMVDAIYAARAEVSGAGVESLLNRRPQKARLLKVVNQ
jgi:integrase